MAIGKEDHDRDVLCGIGKFRPKWLQVFNNPKAMCVFITIYAFTHGFIANGVFNINTTSFERRFHLSSYQVGWISSANDISAATLGLLISFYGAGRHKARWLSMGIAVTAVGCFLMGLPHFLTGLYQWGQNDERICRKEGDNCEANSDPGLSKYLFLLMAGHFLNGVSGSTLMTVGMSYIDDSISSESSPLYTGIVHAMLYVGVGVGYVLGGAALNLYVDFDRVPKDRWIITPRDPRWVGAWWLAFFLATIVYFLLCLVFLLYGSELPAAKKIREEHAKEYKDLTDQPDADDMKPEPDPFIADTHEMSLMSPEITSYGAVHNTAFETADEHIVNGDAHMLDNSVDMKSDGEKEETYTHSAGNAKKLQVQSHNEDSDNSNIKKKIGFKNFFPTLIHLLKSPTFLFLCLAYTCSFMVITSFAVFMAKTVQFQYNQTPTMSAILAGVILIPGAGLGQFLGGFIIQKLGLQVRGSLIVAIVTKGASVPLTFMFLYYCEKMDLAGWNVPYDGSTWPSSSVGDMSFHTDCNKDCNCHQDLYEPVCDDNNKQYFSPCFAGCYSVNSSLEQIYSNCSCLLSVNSSMTVSANACHYGCTKMYYVLAVLFLCLTLMSCIFIPIQTVILRIHSDLDKTFSLGIMWMFARVLGAIPGPIILGAAIDVTCVVWGKTCKEDKASCWIYDNQLLGRNVCIFSTAVNFGATIMLLIAYLFYQTSKHKKTASYQLSSDIKQSETQTETQSNDTKD